MDPFGQLVTIWDPLRSLEKFRTIWDNLGHIGTSLNMTPHVDRGHMKIMLDQKKMPMDDFQNLYSVVIFVDEKCHSMQSPNLCK